MDNQLTLFDNNMSLFQINMRKALLEEKISDFIEKEFLDFSKVTGVLPVALKAKIFLYENMSDNDIPALSVQSVSVELDYTKQYPTVV